MLLVPFLSLFCALSGVSLAGHIPHHAHFHKNLARAELVDLDVNEIMPRQDSQCTNSPTTRGCWGNGFSIATNYDATWPNTGNVVKYNLEVTNTTNMAPDGVKRLVMAINGQYPGPTIRANWGDTLQITVKNSLQVNGTSMHWHGLRQWKSNPMDGTNGITECPLAPGQTRVYTFLCTQFGTTWYHSHYSDQYTDGVVGTMIIDGPASANYDIDLGTYPINDWYYTPAFTLGPLIQHGAFPRGPPPGDNILINGTNVNSVANATNPGAYSRVHLTKGKKYRLRLINTSTNDMFKVGLDNHTMQVISSDFVPIKPFNTQWIFLGIGQRYDVIINANQNVDSYWFHVVPQGGCSNNLNSNALSIFTYDGATNQTPPNATRTNAPAGADCSDPNASLVPYVKLNVPQNGTIPSSSDLDVGFAITQDSNQVTNIQWNLNFTAIVAPWETPTDQMVLNNNFNFTPSMNVISLPTANAWSFWVIQAVATIAPPLPHPIHLHGHDFYVLGTGTGIFNNSQSLQLTNPPRRDVAMLPAGGYLVIAFITDNPGAWLMHCHIAWHIGLGLGAQFLEEPDQIPNLPFDQSWKNACNTWNSYYTTAQFKEDDSGL